MMTHVLMLLWCRSCCCFSIYCTWCHVFEFKLTRWHRHSPKLCWSGMYVQNVKMSGRVLSPRTTFWKPLSPWNDWALELFCRSKIDLFWSIAHCDDIYHWAFCPQLFVCKSSFRWELFQKVELSSDDAWRVNGRALFVCERYAYVSWNPPGRFVTVSEILCEVEQAQIFLWHRSF